MKLKTALIIPTYNGFEDLKILLESLQSQDFHFDKKLIIDSSSNDNTLALAAEHGFESIVIKKGEFNHGHTRQRAIDTLTDFDIACLMTQDVYFASSKACSKLIEVFQDPDIGAAYGRQIAKPGHNHFAIHARLFNYPDTDEIRSYEDRKKIGMRCVFASNCFAAYRIEALKEVGGFPSFVPLAEDVYAFAKILCAGYKVAYCSKASVYHSHEYPLKIDFKQYFDYGSFHAQESWIQERFGAAGSQGSAYATSEIKYLLCSAPHLIPLSILRLANKFLAYHLGKRNYLLPLSLKKKWSRHPFFWEESLKL